MKNLQPKTSIMDVVRHANFTVASDESGQYYIKESGSCIYSKIDIVEAVKRIKGVTK